MPNPFKGTCLTDPDGYTLCDASGYVTLSQGTAVPTDATANYQVGSLFLKTNGSVGTALYINEGSITSCAFHRVETPGSDPVFTGDVTIGDASTDTLTINSSLAANLLMVKEVDHVLSITTTTTAATAGGALTITAGQGATSGTGGALPLAAGAGGTTGTGGAGSLSGGAGGTTSGAGGVGSIVGGAGGTGGTGNGGVGKVVGGASGTGATGTGGAAQVTGGAAVSTNGDGGMVILTGGAKNGSGLAGLIRFASATSRVVTVGTMTDTATITTANILQGVIKCTPTAAASYTMPTGAVIAAALPAAFTTGDSLDFTLVNVATNDTFDITLVTAASGTTLFGNLIVEANSAAAKWSSGTFRIVCSGASTYDVYRLG